MRTASPRAVRRRVLLLCPWVSPDLEVALGWEVAPRLGRLNPRPALVMMPPSRFPFSEVLRLRWIQPGVFPVLPALPLPVWLRPVVWEAVWVFPV